MRRQQIPYNTGKVKIGSAYTALPQQRIDSSMERVQSALLPPSERLLEANRREARAVSLDAVLWTLGILAFFAALVYAPAIWRFIFE